MELHPDHRTASCVVILFRAQSNRGVRSMMCLYIVAYDAGQAISNVNSSPRLVKTLVVSASSMDASDVYARNDSLHPESGIL